MIWDAIVIGGSFAGLSAAMQLARGQRQVLLIDAGEPRNRFAAQAHGFFAADGAEPGELRGRAWQQLLAYPTVQFRQSRVSSAQKLADGKELSFANDAARTAALEGTGHPLVRTHPVTGRKSLYLASHAGEIVGWPMPEARAFLRDLIEHATQREFVYTHKWRVDDLVMWDNRQTMHRARPFPAHEPRDMRRTTLAGDGPTAEQVAA